MTAAAPRQYREPRPWNCSRPGREDGETERDPSYVSCKDVPPQPQPTAAPAGQWKWTQMQVCQSQAGGDTVLHKGVSGPGPTGSKDGALLPQEVAQQPGFQANL